MQPTLKKKKFFKKSKKFIQNVLIFPKYIEKKYAKKKKVTFSHASKRGGIATYIVICIKTVLCVKKTDVLKTMY